MNWFYLPPWSARLLALTAVALFVVLAVRAWRERRWKPAVLRGVVLAVLLWAALNPTAFVPRVEQSKPKLVVLVDSSASMATRDVNGEARLTVAGQTLASATGLRNFDVDLRSFDRDSRVVEVQTLTPTGDATDLGAALTKAVSDSAETPGAAGVLVISDGRETTEGAVDAARLALARGVPVWTWCVGGAVPRRDLWLETPASEALSFANAAVELPVMVRQAGYPERSFKIELLAGDKVVESREVHPDTRAVFTVTAPAAGEHRYVFRVPAEADEADTGNNERAVFLRVVGEKARVLLAEGQPHWDTKFLVQALKRDPRVELTAVYQLAPQRYVAVVSARGQEQRSDADLFPRTAAAMNQFDIIILGRGAEPFFDGNTEALLTAFVAQRGGSVVFSRGKPYGGRFPALAKLEPLVWGEGATSGARFQSMEEFALDAEHLPAADQAMVTLGEKPLATVLSAENPNAILLAHQRYGLGRTLTLNAAGLWRWAFGDTDQERGEQAYTSFWLSLLRWLLAGDEFLPGADVALTSARRSYTSDQLLQFLIRTRQAEAMADYQPRLTIAGNGQSIDVQPRLRRAGNFEVEAGPLAPGTYRVTLANNVGLPASLNLDVDVVSASVEKRELSADAGLMGRLAEMSGGQALTAPDVARFDDVYRHWQAKRRLAQREATVWDRWWILVAVVGLLGTEWWLRRREGLL